MTILIGLQYIRSRARGSHTAEAVSGRSTCLLTPPAPPVVVVVVEVKVALWRLRLRAGSRRTLGKFAATNRSAAAVAVLSAPRAPGTVVTRSTSAMSVLAVVLEVLLVAAGLDLAITGALGHCPLYAKLGHVPASLRKSS